MRYNALLEGLEVAEVKHSNLEYTGRLDSEYYRKHFLGLEKLISKNKHIELSEDSAVLIGPFGSAFDTDNYTDYDSGYRYIRGQDVKPFLLQNSHNRYIPKSEFDRLSKYSVRTNDIMVSVVGTLGNACIVEEKDTPAIFSCKSSIIRPNKVNSYYLIAFLNSNIGKDLLVRQERGAIQKGLNLDDIKRIKIPLFSSQFDSKIQKTIQNAYLYVNQSYSLYTQATELLEETLGLKNWQPSEENINVQRFSNSFAATGRIDAEYYQPKYEELERIITKNNFYRLADLVENISTGFPYDSSKFLEEGIKLIRINNITPQGLNLDNAACLTENDAGLSPKDKIKKNDIVISMSGTIGLSCCVKEEVNAFINQRIMKFSTKSYNPDVLSLIINSIVGKTQLERVGTGGVQTNLSNTDILNIKIPEIINSKQTEIANLINTSYNLKQQSTQLLEQAKQAVEIAIEQGEEAAIEFLEN